MTVVAITQPEFVPPYLPQPESYAPTHPDCFEIEFASGAYSSCLRTTRAFKKGDRICAIEGTRAGSKEYSSVQVRADPPVPGSADAKDESEPRHIELCSDLLYVNHSCDPNVAFEVPSDKSKWAVRALKDLPKGEIMTFAYFSTEWDMKQTFQCLCESSKCLGQIQGAKYIPASKLGSYFVNEHILALKKHQQEA